MFFLTGGYFVVELVYGIIIGSLALQADAFHMASDLIALVVGFYSLIVARRAPTPIASFGWMRMEVHSTSLAQQGASLSDYHPLTMPRPLLTRLLVHS